MSPVVATTHGAVRGKIKDGVASWRGIPYAAPPVGPLRLRPPRAAEPWTGERDATRFGAVAVQARDPRVAVLSGVGEKAAMSEDCLTLNVTAPASAPGDGVRRPVLVWIHGGAFIMGSGSTPIYDGATFAARHDLVVVTLNYRLGLLGFLYLGDLAAGRDHGNLALLDQIAALAWVRDNIAAFGGDPDAVTVMGESAGAVSIANLLVMPAARGLFQRAILQSGASGLSPPTRADATALAHTVLAELATTPDGLADVPVDRLLALQDRIARERGLSAFAPYVDEVTVPGRPIDLVRAGLAAGVSLLCGTNRDEWTLFELFLGDASVVPLQAVLRARLGDALVDRMLAAYTEARADRAPARAWIDLIGDTAFRIPIIRLAEAQAERAPVWLYRFDWASTGFGGRLGAAHALELPFVWNKLDLPVSHILLGGADQAEAARPLATAMHDSWAAFVRTGDPAVAALPAWPRYQPPRRATMLFDRTCALADDPGGAVRAMWPVE